jgi:hypothetical protein
MGWGDEIIAGGQARRMHRESGMRVRIVDKGGRMRWSDVWAGLPYVVHPLEQVKETFNLLNAPGARPYIQYPFNRCIGCTYSGWRCRDYPPEWTFHVSEPYFAMGQLSKLPSDPFPPLVYIEPTISIEGNQNKQWGVDKWVELVRRNPNVTFVQCGNPHTGCPLPGAFYIETPTFRHAVAVMSLCNTAVLPEGGLHHAARALGKRVVVLFGGTVNVDSMGYPEHVNIVEGEPCGNWKPCPHCVDAWNRVEVDRVSNAMWSTLRG